MSSGAHIYDRLAEALAEIRPRFGAAGFSDRRRVIGLLADKVPDAKREIRVVGTAIDEGVPQTLARTERHLVGVEMDRLANGLEASTGLRLDIARQVVRSFAFALDMGPPPSIYEQAAAMAQGAQPPPAPPPDAWAGLSQPTAPVAPPYSQPITQYPAAPGPSAPYQATAHATAHATQPLGFAGQAPPKPNMAGRIALAAGGVILLAYGASQIMGGGETRNDIAANGQTGTTQPQIPGIGPNDQPVGPNDQPVQPSEVTTQEREVETALQPKPDMGGGSAETTTEDKGPA